MTIKSMEQFLKEKQNIDEVFDLNTIFNKIKQKNKKLISFLENDSGWVFGLQGNFDDVSYFKRDETNSIDISVGAEEARKGTQTDWESLGGDVIYYLKKDKMISSLFNIKIKSYDKYGVILALELKKDKIGLLPVDMSKALEKLDKSTLRTIQNMLKNTKEFNKILNTLISKK